MSDAKIRMYRFLVEMGGLPKSNSRSTQGQIMIKESDILELLDLLDSQEEIILKQNNIIRELTTENLRLLNIIESQQFKIMK